MQIERTKNAGRNIVFGFVLKVFQLVLPFVVRTVMIYWMGTQYTGLNGLFTSVFQVLNLAELGVGNALVFSMYKPIIEDDKEMICKLLKLYQKYYRIIGIVIAVSGIACTPLLPYLIKADTDIPSELNLYVLYYMNLGVTVLSYWLLAYKQSLFQAHQRNDITSKIMLFVSFPQYLLQIIVIIVTRNYYAFLCVALFSQVATNLIVAAVSSKMYPNYRPVGDVESGERKLINKRIADLFTSKIGAVIVNSADTLVVSAFLGLTMLTIYQNYFFLISAIIGIVAIIFGSCTAGIGNSIIVESKEKNYEDLKKLTFLISWIAAFCSACFLNLLQPFMDIWVGDKLKLEFSAVIVLVVYYFIYEINQLLNTYKDAAGIWHKDRFRPLITALSNLILNLLTVRIIGIYGVLLSTVIAMVAIGMPWILINLFSELFEMKRLKGYVFKLFYYAFIAIVACVATYYFCSLIHYDRLQGLILKMIVCVIVPNVVLLLGLGWFKEFRMCLALLNKITNGKIKMLRKYGR